LYDLGVGIPFLFVDELAAEMPKSIGIMSDGMGRRRVQLAAPGEWQEAAR
jgi:hypothetical protein